MQPTLYRADNDTAFYGKRSPVPWVGNEIDAIEIFTFKEIGQDPMNVLSDSDVEHVYYQNNDDDD